MILYGFYMILYGFYIFGSGLRDAPKMNARDGRCGMAAWVMPPCQQRHRCQRQRRRQATPRGKLTHSVAMHAFGVMNSAPPLMSGPGACHRFFMIFYMILYGFI